MTEKKPFDIDFALERMRDAVKQYPKAVLFELADEGYDDPFEQLVACVLSIRTRDETLYPMAKAFFARARTPVAVSKMTVAEIDALIGSSAFHERKAAQIREMAQRIVKEHNGELPCEEDLFRSFDGVGPKCTNLVLAIACGKKLIGVDVHVHRVTNRWGYVDTNAPEQTLRALEKKLPRRYWVEINRLLVPFGKHICTSRRPYCSNCPVLAMCAQARVDNPR